MCTLSAHNIVAKRSTVFLPTVALVVSVSTKECRSALSWMLPTPPTVRMSTTSALPPLAVQVRIQVRPEVLLLNRRLQLAEAVLER
jgi:hypothetical protein